MSHSSGEIWSENGKLCGYFEYDGTSDVVCTRVHLTTDGVTENWRNDNYRNCTCGRTSEPVILYTYYGYGFHWNGRVCWNCMAVTDGIFELDTEYGHPFFNEWMIAHYGKLLECPKCKESKLRTDGDKAPIVCTGCGAHLYEWEVTCGGGKAA